jgi:hypothetical protein
MPIGERSLYRDRVTHRRLFNIGRNDKHLPKMLRNFSQRNQTRAEDAIIIRYKNSHFASSTFHLH